MIPSENNPFAEEEPTIDLRQYVALFLQWWWLVVLAALLAGGVAYLFSQRMAPIYSASTTLLINEAPSNRTTDYTSIITSERLAQTYAEMIVKRPVLEEVIRRLSIPYSPDQLKSMISVAPVRDTQLLTITVESEYVSLAPAVANALVVVFTEQLRETQSSRFAASKENLQKQMSDTEAQITQIRQDMETATDRDEVNRLETRLNQYEQIYANLVLSYEGIRTTEAQSASNVEQIEIAVMNSTPVSPNVMQNTLLAAMVGFMLAVGGIFGFSLLDDTIKSPEDIRRKLNLPIVGTIPRFEEIEDGRLITQALPRSPVTESFRALRVHVQHSYANESLRTLIVTSPTPSDGKTTVASNLAVVMSRTGMRVTVVDADMHRPRVHSMFNINFQPGLSSMFVGPLLQLNGTVQKTAVDSLYVMSAGKLPPNPSELLGSQKMREILDLVLEKSDLVIIDTPPVLSVTDAMVLAPAVDGVLLVVKPGVTKISMLQTMVDQLRYVGARIVGVVINGIDERNPRYGYYYKSYQYQTYKNYDRNSSTEKHRWGRKAEKIKQAEFDEAED